MRAINNNKKAETTWIDEPNFGLTKAEITVQGIPGAVGRFYYKHNGIKNSNKSLLKRRYK